MLKKLTTKFSIVIPVYNEQENIPILYKRVKKVLNKLSTYHEIIFINDGSKDQSIQLLLSLSLKDKKIKIINFSRNFGHQTAVTAGLHYCSGKFVAIIDADLQDPPEVLPKFFEKLQTGYDVVYAVRKKRKENFLLRIAYSVFYKILKSLANIDIPLDTGDFCVMTQRMVKHINLLPENNRFIRGIRSWIGLKQCGLEYERAKRYQGASKYTLNKYFKLAFDGIFSFSHSPLQLMFKFGVFSLLLSILSVFLVVYIRLFTDIFVPGFATTVILISFLGGLQMFSIGLIGEYVARIYDEVKNRPPYIIDSKIGFNK